MKQYTKPSITEILIEDNATLKMWAAGDAVPCVAKEAFDVASTSNPAGSVACGQSTVSIDVSPVGGLYPTLASLVGLEGLGLGNVGNKDFVFMDS